MVAIKCRRCGGVGFKSYPFGKVSGARSHIKHDSRCKYNKDGKK